MEGLADMVLSEGQADEYARLLNDYPICHDDAIAILKAVAVVMSQRGFNGTQMAALISEMQR
ncbi:hypothetical protein [Paenibacillus agilis]|uniref:Uncharacterized protein n=1 Tax=Paenibacillus agilis TaxID=3020863 RepID=A0A559IZI8_9BACL|nr:hypothetical protein [Paenibacillus agilis]TVX93034.1 hypothetical protein FPZ44_08165 [Paenibacillus agilis]